MNLSDWLRYEELQKVNVCVLVRVWLWGKGGTLWLNGGIHRSTCQWHFWEGCRGWRRKGPKGPAAGDVGAKRLTPSKAADKSHRLLMSWKFVLSTRGAFWAKPPVSQCGSTLTPQKETVNFFSFPRHAKMKLVDVSNSVIRTNIAMFHMLTFSIFEIYQ